MTAFMVLAGSALLVARPALVRTGWGPPAVVVAAIFVVLLVGAVLTPAPAAPPGRRSPLLLVALVGIAVFAAGRLIGGGDAPAQFTMQIVALNTLAAVAEEAFFRRFVFAVLAPAGPAFAIGGTAALFALVHLTSYGAWVLPIDAAAGVVLGWQRWATNSWSVPAATHAVANVFVVV